MCTWGFLLTSFASQITRDVLSLLLFLLFLDVLGHRGPTFRSWHATLCKFQATFASFKTLQPRNFSLSHQAHIDQFDLVRSRTSDSLMFDNIVISIKRFVPKISYPTAFWKEWLVNKRMGTIECFSCSGRKYKSKNIYRCLLHHAPLTFEGAQFRTRWFNLGGGSMPQCVQRWMNIVYGYVNVID
jgi:hypothetical protein